MFTCVNNDDFTVLVSEGGRCTEHVYCVATTFKITEKVEQQIIKFCVKLDHSYAETIQMIQKTADMGN